MGQKFSRKRRVSRSVSAPGQPCGAAAAGTGAPEPQQQGLGRLHRAAARGHLAWLRRWRRWMEIWGIDRRDRENRTPLHLASANGHTEVVRFLVRHRCRLDAADNFGRTPLMRAVQFHQEDCVAFLLEHGADPNLTDTDGHTALHLAIQAHDKNLVRLLLRHFVDHRAKNKEGFTPLALAVSEGQEEIVEILLKAGVDVHARDQHQRTPLMIAASVGQLNLVQVLLSYGANISHEDTDGNTAEDYADLHGYWSLSQYLAKMENTSEAPAGDAQGDNILKILRIPERAGAAGEMEAKTDQENRGEAPACDTEDTSIVITAEDAGAAPFLWGAPAVDRGATDDLCEGGSIRSSEEEGNDDTWSDSEESICFSPKVKKEQKPNLLELWNIFLEYGKAGLQAELEALQKEKAEEGHWTSLCGSQEESPEEEEMEENQEQEELKKELWAAIAACVPKYIFNESPGILTGTAENKTGEHSGSAFHTSSAAKTEA
ncbi:POTE ankyrin domain family member B-like [Heliangelus exortis]|uniref:POTE ankyrin domain family member B-like n=1 Tax=Heliangelus exortis TaxID=472823 RepID=UPI003A8DA6BD